MSPMRYTQVSDSLAAHKADLKQFWRRVRATRGKFWLLFVAGESEFVPSDPTATRRVLVKTLCSAGDFNPNLYRVRNCNQLSRAVRSPLVGTIATLLRENHSEGDDDEFFRIESFLDICGMTGFFLRGDSALAAGRVVNLHVIEANGAGEPDFSKVFSCERRGDHAVVETRPLETLFAVAVDESSSPIAVALRRRVDALHADALAAIESKLAARDAFAEEIEDILEGARASGKHPSTIGVLYQPRISIGGGNRVQGVETDFVVRETALRSFQGFDDMLRKAAREGFRLLDCRVINRGDGRPPAIRELLPAADRCLADSIMVFMPDGCPFDSEGMNNLPNVIAAAARRGRVFVAAALDIFVEKQLWENPLSTELDCCRVWAPASEGHRELLITLGDAALPTSSNVVLNTAAKKTDGTPRLRTVEAVAAELAKERAKQKAEPAVALTGYERSTPSTKMEEFDLEALLVIDPEGERLLNVEGARSLLVKWTGQVKLYDEDNSYTVKWGGVMVKVAKDFKDIFRCDPAYGTYPDGKNIKSPKGALTMRYYIKVLKDAIKDATGEEEED